MIRDFRVFSVIVIIFVLMAAGCNRFITGISPDDDFEDIGSAPVMTYIPVSRLVVELKETLPELMEQASIPGLSAALIRDGEVVWVEGFGVRSTVTGEKVTEETVFEACSLSKPVFAYALMKMVDYGDIDLDRPLVEYTGLEYIEREFLKRKSDDDRIMDITARHVLAHMTGFPNWRNAMPIEISFDPGTSFSYSGEGYILLQAVVEKIKDKKLEPLMRELVLDPLKMEKSSFVWREAYHESGAFPHAMTGIAGGMRIRRRGSAAASLYTTAADFARFLSAVLKGEGLTPESTEEMLSKQCGLVTETPGALSWGLGFGLQHVRNEESIWHWGDNGEYKCCVLGYRKWKSGLVYFTNSENGLAITEEIVNIALGGENPLFESEIMENYGNRYSPSLEVIRTAIAGEVDQAVEIIRKLRVGKENDSVEIIDEQLINSLGYRLMYDGRSGEAVTLFRLNVEFFPESFNVYDSLGEAFMKLGMKDAARENYERSISLRGDSRSGLWALKRLGFVPDDLSVPVSVDGDGFRLAMLTERLAGPEYEAIMSSVESLRELFGSPYWPREGLTLEQEKDMLGRHRIEFQNRYSFAWAVMDVDGKRVLGGVYINPSFRDEYDAEVFYWVRDSEAVTGLEDRLGSFLRDWIGSDWSFERVAWPGREISWDEWRRR
ncbi:MAG: beta-lactamase family protein [Bacteroidales bacterium]|nr:beta-lactamase family protein [Candidatus Latescibacterota bacterium]